MEMANIALDAFCIVLCVVLGSYTLVVDDRTDRIAVCFAGICFSNALMAAGDIASWAFVAPLDGLGCFALGALSFLYFAATVPVFSFFSGYIALIVRRRGAHPRHLARVWAVLFAIHLAGCAVSLAGDGFFFRVTQDAGYERGAGFLLSQALPVALHLRNTFLVVGNRSLLTRRELAGFACYIVLPVVAGAVQLSHYGIALMSPFISCAVLLVFLGVQADRRQMLKRRERELADARADIMMSQIKPHFLYNSLTAIRELCLTDPREAAFAITDFSRFLRDSMASLTSRDPVPFDDELRHVETYLNLEKRRFGKRLDVVYDIRARAFEVPPLSIQVLAENAVKHGVAKRAEGGRIVISACEVDGGFEVVVADDGVGFEAVPSEEGACLGVGMSNVRMRLASQGGSLSVESEVGCGTRVRVFVPGGLRCT